MKKIYIYISLLIVSAFSFNTAWAAQNNSAGSENKGGQIMVTNQNEEIKLQVEATPNGSQNSGKDAQGPGVQLKEQDKQMLQDGSEEGNQVMNQGNADNGQTNSSADKSNGSENAQPKRSQIASAVQEMLQLADGEDNNIGEQIRTIAQEQNQNQVKLEEGLVKIQNRNSLVKLLIGADYGEIGSAQEIIGQNQEQIRQLNEIKNQLANEGDQTVLEEQIQVLEQANGQMQNAIDNSQSGFSLLGWFFKIFSK